MKKEAEQKQKYKQKPSKYIAYFGECLELLIAIDVQGIGTIMDTIMILESSRKG